MHPVMSCHVVSGDLRQRRRVLRALDFRQHGRRVERRRRGPERAQEGLLSRGRVLGPQPLRRPRQEPSGKKGFGA